MQCRRFTLDGSEDLERRLALLCSRVAREVQSLIPESGLEGLVLAGGYGRGEGGVLRIGNEDHPYNDLEFYVLARGNALVAERRHRASLHDLGAALSPTAGLDVEFKVITRAKLRHSAPSMFHYDLVTGGRWILGEASLFAGCDHHRDPRAIPLHEATRLLMNRSSGLLFSAERLRRMEFGPADADFVGRNLAKVQLALGDVLLTAQGQYHWSCRERERRLAQIAPLGEPTVFEAIRRHHAAGVAFKLHPFRSTASRDELARDHEELSRLAGSLWIWLENLRLGTSFRSAREYASACVDKCPETTPFRNRLVNARTFGPMAAVLPPGTTYPRQRLLHALCLLLWDEAQAVEQIRKELRSNASSFPALVADYERLWHRFN